jgi:alpha-tubulin suppressor-like RCC1 family protein
MSHISNVKQVACGHRHTFAVKYDGSLWSCGDNEIGQLGLGDTTYRRTFTQVTTNINNDVKQVSCGQYHTVILKNDGTVWSCGSNNSGQLGLGTGGDYNVHSTFTRTTSNIINVKEINCAYRQSFVIKNDGTLWACGNNVTGQLGTGNNSGSNRFIQVASDVKKVSTSGRYPTNSLYNDYSIGTTMIIKNDGSLWACGYNQYGGLGLGDNSNKTTFTKVTTNINNDVKDVACGLTHTVILKNDGSIWSCGYNNYGQLGLNDKTNRNTFTKVTTNINNDVKQIACAFTQYYTEGDGGSMFVLKNNDILYSCGYNNHGQLGLGDTTERTTLVKTNVYPY